jgi:integrin alpha FG-GAP repeat containing protein 1
MLPYVYNGIGRSTNYIEQFNVAYSINNKLDQVRVYTPIIPNSYLMVLANKENYKSWQLDLFVNPDAILFQVCTAFGLVLIVIGVVIIMMHIKEKREDSKTGP